MRLPKKAKTAILTTLSVLSSLFACLCSFFTPIVHEFSAYQTCARDVSESDLKWAVGEIEINNYNYSDYRSLIGQLEYNLNIVSRPEYVCFLGNKTNGIGLRTNGEAIECDPTLINISQICQSNDSFGYFYGLPVKPIFTFNYCDWNYILGGGMEPCYISDRVASKLMSSDPSIKDFSDLIGYTYELEKDGNHYSLSVANIFSYDYGAGPMLADYYGELIVVADKDFFNDNLFLNISFTNDLIACRDFCYSVSNYDVTALSIKVKTKNVWRDVKSIAGLSSVCLNKTQGNYGLIAIFGFLFLITELAILFLFKRSESSKIDLIATICVSSLLLLIVTLSNIFSSEYFLLTLFNPLLSLLTVCHIIFIMLVWLKKKKSA